MLAQAEEPKSVFRSYSDFIANTLNPQRFVHVKLDEGTRDADKRWFIYQPYRTPNQFCGTINVGKASIFTAGGIKGGGKSALIGNIATSKYKKIIAAYGSRDDEILAMLRAHDYLEKVPKPIAENLQGLERGLIVGPPNVSVTSSWDYVPYDSLTFNDIYNHDIIVTPQKICSFMHMFFQGSETVTNLLWNRPNAKGTWFLQVLEAANILYSRITLKRAKMDQAKAYLIFLMREIRHMGIAMGLDSQYMVSLDREVRVNSDYTFIKNMGSDRLPNDISWMYGYVKPMGFMSLYPNEFVCKDKYGGVYLGKFMLPPWHKEPEEDLYETMGIRYDTGDVSDRMIQMAEKQEEDPLLHKEIVDAYYNKDNPKAFGSIRGTAAFTQHDRETVKKVINRHTERKCGCFPK